MAKKTSTRSKKRKEESEEEEEEESEEDFDSEDLDLSDDEPRARKQTRSSRTAPSTTGHAKRSPDPANDDDERPDVGPDEKLDDVYFVLSGFVNPERDQVCACVCVCVRVCVYVCACVCV
jgi:hypothetical protein